MRLYILASDNKRCQVRKIIMLPKFWTAGQTKKVNFAA